MSSTFLRHNYIIDLPVLKRRTWSYRGGRAPILSYPLYAHRLTIAAHSALSAHLIPTAPNLAYTYTHQMSISLFLCLSYSIFLFYTPCTPWPRSSSFIDPFVCASSLQIYYAICMIVLIWWMHVCKYAWQWLYSWAWICVNLYIVYIIISNINKFTYYLIY